jgi:hypothetical protein
MAKKEFPSGLCGKCEQEGRGNIPLDDHGTGQNTEAATKCSVVLGPPVPRG